MGAFSAQPVDPELPAFRRHAVALEKSCLNFDVAAKVGTLWQAWNISSRYLPAQPSRNSREDCCAAEKLQGLAAGLVQATDNLRPVQQEMASRLKTNRVQ